jgi:glycosyltransferase involved in cell wall biosynthesis
MKDRHAQHRPDRLRVLYLQPCASFGGAERQASIVIPRLMAHGIDVVPLVGPAPTMEGWLREQGVAACLRSDAFPGSWSSPRPLDQLVSIGRYWRSLRAVAREVDALVGARAIGLIFAAMPFSWIAATPVARRRGVPVVWRAGGTLISGAQKPALRAWAGLYPPDLLLCCSEGVRRAVGPLVPAPAEVVDNGVEADRFRLEQADPARYRPAGARLVVGYAARLAPEKRPQDFVEMAAHLHARHPDVAFLMAGEGSRRAACERLIAARGLQGRVQLLGYLEDVRSFYAACDVLTLPSRSEGLANMVLEAMSMSRALAVSDRAACDGVVRHEREGLVFPVGDVAAYVRCVDRLLTSETLRAALARQARQRVLRDFDVDRSARAIARRLHLLAAAERTAPTPLRRPLPTTP